MSQCDRIISSLRIAPLTAAEAMNELSVGRLAARVEELRGKGHNIHTEQVTAANRLGEECRYGRYHLVKEAK